MNLSYRWLLLQTRPRVIHRLPGRLRIHVPALKKVNEDFQDLSDTLVSKFKLPAGINLAKINYISGNMVIHYNNANIDEKYVLIWVLDIRKIFESVFIKFEKIEEQQIQKSLIKLKDFFTSVSNNGTIIDKNFKIPDEIWN